MYSVLFQIGNISIFSYGLITTLGAILAVSYFIRKAHQHQCHLEFISDHFFIFILSAILGSRLAYVLANWEDYNESYWAMLYFWQDAYSLWGGVIIFLLVFFYYCHRQKEKIGKWMDALVPAFSLGLIFHNAALFMDGSAYGKPTEWFWGVVFETTSVPYTIPVHPTQLYLGSILLFFSILIFPLMMKKYKHSTGVVGWTGLSLISAAYFLVEFARGDSVMMIFGLRWAQVMELIVGIISIAMAYNAITAESAKTTESMSGSEVIS